MSISRRDAIRRLDGLAPRVEQHLARIAENPESRAVSHWKGEIEGWIRQMEGLLRHVGTKTSAEWAAKIAEWKASAGI